MKKYFTKKYILETAVGLQDVDHLTNSEYFLNESQKYIKGEITLEQLDNLIQSYYEKKPLENDNRTKEADLVSIRIGQIIEDGTFNFSVEQFLKIHKTLFKDIFEHAGKIRSYNFIKHEWVLDGDTVSYGDYREINDILRYDFEQEKKFNYKGLNKEDVIDHLSMFVANLWQIHAFEEGNTRTVAVFLIKYLRHLGFDVNNDTFAKNAWYFRNALVRANYSNYVENVFEDRSFLVLFLRNLLLGESNQLKNRYLHINSEIRVQPKDNKIRILQIIRSNPEINTAKLAEELGISVRTLRYLMKSLMENGQLVRENGKRYARWVVKNQ